MSIIAHFQIALVSDMPGLPLQDLTPVAAALQTQVNRDFAAAWQRTATVAAFVPSRIPPGYWPIRIQEDIGQPDALGFHTDENNQPYALVAYGPDWSVTASHELLEMILDPYGNWMTPGHVPGSKLDYSVHVLREACDPCENNTYKINGVDVSDFVTRPYFTDSPASHNVHYSFLNRIGEPFQLDVNGYLSYLDPVSKHWFQITDFGGEQITDLGPNDRAARQGQPLREWIDEQARRIHPGLKGAQCYTSR